jgi:hypothetical protein
MLKRTLIAATAVCAVATWAVAATSGAAPDPNRGLPQGSEPVTLNPADFTTKIDNPYFPMKPGNRWVYRETDSSGKRERVVVKVTHKTKKFANGITARVVTDIATAHGKKTEATDDWYAQDAQGNIWYLGEKTAEYKHGKVSSRAGSFEAGVNGAQAGVAMPANPVPGLSYRQEYLKGKAEDKGAIVTVGQEKVEVPFGFFKKDVVMTRDLTPLEPRVQELKFYARGVGPVLSVHLDGTGSREELIRFTKG